ncbi:MAG: hypothetical protein ABEJ57_06270 [Halobacteriaceae archaeon]
MSLRERVASTTVETVVVRGSQAGIAALLFVGLVRIDPRLVVNAGLALIGTVLPAILARDARVNLGAGVTAMIAAALFFHTLGMVGVYEAINWWDHLTHVFSAALVASLGYALTRAVDRHVEALYLPPRFTVAFIVLATLAVGVLWEVLEFLGRQVTLAVGATPLLVQYGLEDTMLDLVFDAIGAILIGVFGVGRLSRLVGAIEAGLWSGTDRENGS